jgi:hypothetical protein
MSHSYSSCADDNTQSRAKKFRKPARLAWVLAGFSSRRVYVKADSQTPPLVGDIQGRISDAISCEANQAADVVLSGSR